MDPTWIVRLDAPGDGPRLAVKDCIDVEGLPTTAGCQVVAEQAGPAARDAAVVAVARRSGARIVGKTSLTELCWSASGMNPWLGTPPNPLDPVSGCVAPEPVQRVRLDVSAQRRRRERREVLLPERLELQTRERAVLVQGHHIRWRLFPCPHRQQHGSRAGGRQVVNQGGG